MSSAKLLLAAALLPAALAYRNGFTGLEDADDASSLPVLRYQFAASNAASKFFANSTSGWFHSKPKPKSPTKTRVEFMTAKMETDLDGAQQGLLALPNLSPELVLPKGGEAKVAFIFLLMDGVDNEDVWEAFFAKADKRRYSIYTHRAKPGDGTSAPLESLGAIAVHQVAQAWCALAGLEVSVFAAAMEDKANAQFVLLSQNAVPLKNFDFVYQRLVVESRDTSKICFASSAQYPKFLETQLYNELHGECHFRDYYQRQSAQVRKHHQWLVLARRHAHVFLRRFEEALRAYNSIWQRTALDLKDGFEGCSDESVVSAALLLDLAERRKEADGKATTSETFFQDLREIGVEQSCPTFLRWRNCFQGTPLQLTDTFLSDVGKVMKSGAFKSFFNWEKSLDERKNTFQSRALTAVNGFPHFFGPPAKDPTVDLAYLRQLVLREGFLFGRKFNKGVVVKREDGATETLLEALTSLWDAVDEDEAVANVWTRLDVSGRPGALGR